VTPGFPPERGGDTMFAAGGEAGRLMAALDWADTPVGPVGSWPAGLRSAVRTVLASRLPTVLTWGPENLQFYNDAYIPLIGAKHPTAMGRVTSSESREARQPPIEHTMTTLGSSGLPELLLPLNRAGHREETYFTVSHAPAFDDDGQVAGMHRVCTEVTERVLGARRQRLLHVLSTAGSALGNERETVTAMCAAVEGDLDVPFAAVYLSSPGAPGFRRVAAVGCEPALLPTTAHTHADLMVAVDGLDVSGGPFGDLVTDAVVLPLTARDGEPIGLLLAGRSPNRALDAEYSSFYELVAGQFAVAVGNVRAFEAERQRAQRLAEQDRARTTFFSDVSHELRTPLTLLLGPIGDVLDDATTPLPAGVREQLAMALRNGQRLQRLVNGLLDVAGMEAGHATPVRVETDVAVFTADLAGIFRAATERAGLRLSVDCPPLGRPAYVDPRMWETVVINLLANAVKYTFVGGIEVGLTRDGERFVLTVSDTGVGIVAEELPQLFERFHRVPGATARTREGTGIGLALVHELAVLHGGSVSVTSEPGMGSAFTVALPFGAPDEVEGPPAAVEPSGAARGEAASQVDGTSRPTGSPASGVTAPRAGVLVVDDDADMRAYLTRLLGTRWEVRTAGSGQEALAVVAERAPDIVLTDVMMPRVDGFGLLRALRSGAATRDIPVIMLTARAGQEAAVEGLEAGADDYLAKPFRADELIARVRTALDRAAGRATTLRTQRAPVTRAAAAEALRVPAPRPLPAVPGAPARRRPGPPSPRRPVEGRGATGRPAHWRVPSDPSSIPTLRYSLRAWLEGTAVTEDQAYDLLLAACEAATNAIEHAQDPTEPFVEVTAALSGNEVRITVRDHGQWRERMPSMDRGRGSTLMSAFGEVTAVPSPQGTTVVITSRLTPRSSTAPAG
jgi:signal transduction histidine kinase/FixJ family two-component response regulator